MAARPLRDVGWLSGEGMENFNDYDDQELIEEMGIAAWAAVMHDGVLRAKAWARFNAVTSVLQTRFPTVNTSSEVTTHD